MVSRHRCPQYPVKIDILTAAGPVAQNVKAESAKTRNEFADLANSRQTPDHTAANGQPLTHYHSLFYRLLSWKNPRATAISFVVSVLFIFAVRYLSVIPFLLKILYMVLGITATAEFAGKLALGRGLTAQFRPKTYFTIPKASLERFLDDAEQFINFFVIESQRIIFAENVYITGAVSLALYFATTARS
jgi:ABC-type multidrug transport system fused ATPase/permease subunit